MPGSHEVVVIVADRRLDIVEVHDAVVCRAGIVVIVFTQGADEGGVRDVVFEVGQGLDGTGSLVLDRDRAGIAGRELVVVGRGQRGLDRKGRTGFCHCDRSGLEFHFRDVPLAVVDHAVGLVRVECRKALAGRVPVCAIRQGNVVQFVGFHLE